MKKLFIAAFIFLVFVSAVDNGQRDDNLVLTGIPEIPASIGDRLYPYQNIRSARFVDWLPDNKGILIKTRFSETNQIHSVETPGGQRRQLTFFNEPIDECTVCPDFDKSILLFTKDSAGNERHQIYKYDYRTGIYTLLTDGKEKYNSVVWSNKGDKYAFRSNRRNRRDYDIYLGDPSGMQSFTAILAQGGYWYPVEFSPDDRKLLVKKYISSGESYYYILDLSNKQITALDDDTAATAYGTARWAPDMNGIYVIADRSGIFKQLFYYDLHKKDFRVLTGQIPWDIMEIEIAPVGNILALTSNEAGYTRLYLMDTENGQLNRVNLPDGQIYGLSFKPGAAELAITVNRPQQPSDVYVLNLGSKKSIRWTHSELGGLDASAFIAPRVIHYPTFDSIENQPRTIPAYYYEPVKYKPPYPVLIDCHGGPATQEKPYFSYLFQFYLNEMGIAVIAPNIRGSTGYGREFMLLDDRDKREDAVKDIGALLDWVQSQPQLDARRVAIKGGSYGGYMALAAMVHYSDRLCCGVDEWGISHFVTFLKNTGKYRQDIRRTEYGDERDPAMRELLDAISPLTNAHRIEKPMFIVQGLHDPRVPVSEAEQIAAAIRKNGVDVWYLLAKDEGHGFGKKSNRNIYQQVLILFLEKYLLDKD